VSLETSGTKIANAIRKKQMVQKPIRIQHNILYYICQLLVQLANNLEDDCIFPLPTLKAIIIQEKEVKIRKYGDKSSLEINRHENAFTIIKSKKYEKGLM
jgi:hypothetical protein